MKAIKLLPLLISFCAFAQDDIITVNEAVSLALKNNLGIKSASQNILYEQQLKKTNSEIPKMEVSSMYGQYNSVYNDLNNSVLQTIPFPTVFTSRAAVANSKIKVSEAKKALTENELIFQVKITCNRLLYLRERNFQLVRQDSLFEKLATTATKKYQAGETNQLEMTKAVTQHNEIRNLLNQNLSDQLIYESNLQVLLNAKETVRIAELSFEALPFPEIFDSVESESIPALQYLKYQVETSENLKRLEKAKFLPDLKFGFFSQSLTGVQNINGQDQFFGRSKKFNGLQLGINLPIWFMPHTALIKASELSKQSINSEYQQSKLNWWAQTKEAFQQAIKYKTSLDYYTNSGLPMAELIQRQSLQSFKQGEIGFTEFLLNMNQALGIRESYLQNILDYNQSIIRIELLTAQRKN